MLVLTELPSHQAEAAARGKYDAASNPSNLTNSCHISTPPTRSTALTVTLTTTLQALPIFIDRLADPITAVLVSVTVVLIFGEWRCMSL